eukprot:jgi/Botrbrau1/7942/Bobra.9_2s0100.1
MLPGIDIGGRKYEFLAYSSSQLKEQSVWLFAPHPRISAHDCFSSTVDAITLQVDEVETIDDVETGGKLYCFSDGVGRMSQDVCLAVSNKLKRLGRWKRSYYPCAVQIRFQGCKGNAGPRPSPLREKNSSQEKHDQVRDTAPEPGGVHDSSADASLSESTGHNTSGLSQRLRSGRGLHQVAGYDDETAGRYDQQRRGRQGRSSTLSCLLLQELRKKTRILVPDGACVLGVMDEVGILQYGQVFIQIEKVGPFRRASNRPEWDVVTGDVVVAKNPSSTLAMCVCSRWVPVCQAVDVPQLRHLHNVVVFPQVGPRPHPNELSGSDLDGDIYFVTWNRDLLPPYDRRNPEAGSYPAVVPKEKELGELVTPEDLVEFLIDFAKNDNLGIIANMHLAIANTSPDGAWDQRCLKLAALHSQAVDFPKSGVPAEFPYDIYKTIKDAGYPDFMENKGKESVLCQTVVGKLYRMVKQEEQRHLQSDSYHADARRENEFDEDLSLNDAEVWFDAALVERWEYEVQLIEIMNHFGVYDEAELVGGAVLKFSKYHKNRSASDVRQKVSEAISSLRRRTIRAFEEDVANWVEKVEGPRSSMDTSGARPKFRIHPEIRQSPLFWQYAYQKASAWYIVTYHPHFRRYGGADISLRSFPWVAARYLNALKQMDGEL